MVSETEPAAAWQETAVTGSGLQIMVRPWTAGDAAAFVAAARESVAEVFPWLPWCHADYSLADSLAWVEHTEASWREGTAYEFAIVGVRGMPLGGCGLNQLRPVHRLANLGYWVRTSATGRGVAAAAVELVSRFAFTRTDLIRLEIVVDAENRASRRVAEKAGAVCEGVAHDRLFVHERTRDAVMYALLRSRYCGPGAP